MAAAFSCILASLFLFCGKGPEPLSRPIIAVSIAPQKFFVEKIAGNLFDIMVMLPPGASPHTFEPKPSQMAALSKATLYLSIGVEFEKAWLDRIAESCPKMVIAATDSGIEKIALQDGENEEPSVHGRSAVTGHHEHEGLDPHIWLAPSLVRQQAAAITRALCRIDPSHSALFEKNDSLFGAELSLLQDTIRQILAAGKPGRSFLVFHPSWGYFAKEFGLKQVSIEVQGKEPTPRELAAILDMARSTNTTAIYTQPQFSQRTAQTIAAEIGARVVIADPLDSAWETNLVQCAKALGGR
jgi:zinc transport system substrate-binding protein